MFIRNRIFVDYNSTTPCDPQVIEAMEPYYQEIFGNPHSNIHSFGWEANKAVEESIGGIAKILNVDEDEIILTSGATEANNLALVGMLPIHQNCKKKLLIGINDHSSIYKSASELQNRGKVDTFKIPVDTEGLIVIEEISKQIDNAKYHLASIESVNGEIGTIQNLEKIYDILYSKSVIFHTDAAQAPNAIDISKIISNCDLMSLSAHKIYGPKGIGLLYISKEIQEDFNPVFFGGGQQFGIRPGTIPVPLLVGFFKALSLIHDNSANERIKLSKLRDYFFNSLKKQIPGIKINGPKNDQRHPGNLNIQIPNVNSDDLILRLQPRIAASSGSACSSGIPTPSRVLREIGLSRDEANSSLRFCLGRFSDYDQIDMIVEQVSKTVNSIYEIG